MADAYNKTRKAADAYNAAAARFIVAELDLAITFCHVGLSSPSQAHAGRSVDDAQRALDAVSRMKKKFRLTTTIEKEVASKTSQLKALLERLKTRSSLSIEPWLRSSN